MAKVLFLKGLPGSGKSTLARELERQGWVRVNKDDIRKEMGLEFSRSRSQEYSVIDRRDDLICKALEEGKSVVVDDTNFGRKHEPRIRELAARYGASFEIDDSFLQIPIEVCIERDSKREGKARVGEDVIWGMAEQHLGMKRGTVQPNLDLRSAIICDLDGTLCIHNGRGPFDYEKCDTDLVNEPVRKVLDLFSFENVTIIFMSGREDKAKEKTESWLKDNGIGWDHLFMRASGDFRKDSIVKRELFDQNVRDKYNVLFVMDDRNQVVDMWREIGLTCFQVAPGNF